MDIAIVTGASSALGQAISSKLLDLGFRIYGFGGDYSRCELKNSNFIPVSCDLSNPLEVDREARKILEKERGIFVLIHNAKFYPRDRFLETHGEILERSLKINLLCPLILTQIFARSLCQLQGFVFQLGPTSQDMSRGGVIGATAAGGLRWMGDALFQELRNEGVRVCHIAPEANPRPAHSSKTNDLRKETVIDSEAVANAMIHLIKDTSGNIVTELVIRPQRTEPDGSPLVRTLPYPDPKPIPYTVPKEIIEAEEYLEEQELQKKEKVNEQKRKPRRRGGRRKSKTSSEGENSAQKPNEKPEAVKEKAEAAPPQDSQQKPRRRKGRKPRPGGPDKKSSEAPSETTLHKATSQSSTPNRRKKSSDKRSERTNPEESSPPKHQGNTPPKKKSKQATAKDDSGPKKKPARKVSKKKVAKKKTAARAVKSDNTTKKTAKKAAQKEKPAVKKTAKKNAPKKSAKKKVKAD